MTQATAGSQSMTQALSMGMTILGQGSGRRRHNPTFNDQAEMIIEDTAEWGANLVEALITNLMPDGRMFGQEKMTEREQARAYVEKLRGNGAAWQQFIEDRVQIVRSTLLQFGLGEDVVKQAHPYNIVQMATMAFSRKMERILGREQVKYEKYEREKHERYEIVRKELTALRPPSTGLPQAIVEVADGLPQAIVEVPDGLPLPV